MLGALLYWGPNRILFFVNWIYLIGKIKCLWRLILFLQFSFLFTLLLLALLQSLTCLATKLLFWEGVLLFGVRLREGRGCEGIRSIREAAWEIGIPLRTPSILARWRPLQPHLNCLRWHRQPAHRLFCPEPKCGWANVLGNRKVLVDFEGWLLFLIW